jgi:hypothetical protein
VTWPTPVPGLVIRYAYLWEEAALAGREEGEKDRPCAVLLAHREEDGRVRVYALPITHSAPARPGHGVEIPRAVKEHLGLNDDRSWVILTEANVFFWPGPDLRFPQGRGRQGLPTDCCRPGCSARYGIAFSNCGSNGGRNSSPGPSELPGRLPPLRQETPGMAPK